MTYEATTLNASVLLAITALGFGPGLFWLWYFHRKDLEPEPRHLVRNCFLMGMIAVIPAVLLESLFRVQDAMDAIVVAPIVEECLKLVACFLVIWRNAHFDEPMDGIIYAVAVALGFASVENCFYLAEAYRQSMGDFGVLTILRAFFSVPGHALYAVMWGYGLGHAKFSKNDGILPIGAGFALAVAVHATFNFLASLGPIWPIGMLIFIPVVWGLANRKIEHALQTSPHLGTRSDFRNKFYFLKDTVAAKIGSAGWYENRLTVVLLLFLVCFPVGFYGLYHNSTFSRPEKAAYVVLWGLMWGLIGGSG